MTKLSFYFRRLLDTMWFLPAAFSAISLVTIVLAFYTARWAPEELPFSISQDAIQSVLQILATSLLTVSVFALSTLVSALSSAAAATSPRAVPLLIGDRAAQTSISVFIGGFLFSILAILGLSAGIYSSAGRMLLFSVTLCVVAVVVASLIRWIAQISNIGRVSHTVDRVEAATEKALRSLRDNPLFGCGVLDGPPVGAPVWSHKVGYVQHFDAARLQEVAEEHDLRVTLALRPGAFVTSSRPLMWVAGETDDRTQEKLAEAFVIGDQRSFDSDPRYGLIILAEIAGRALSPAVNDPGTAIDVIGTVTRLLAPWQPADASEPKYPLVLVPELSPDDLIEDAFRPIARDGAASIEVVIRLLKCLDAIARTNPYLREAARKRAADATARAQSAINVPSDLALLAS